MTNGKKVNYFLILKVTFSVGNHYLENICPVGKKYMFSGKKIWSMGKKYMPNGKKIYAQWDKNICLIGKKYMSNGKNIYALLEKKTPKFYAF